jgi:integrase
MKLTDRTIAGLALPKGKTDFTFWDDALPCFGVRLRGGAKHFTIHYRVGPIQHKESLGNTKKITLEQARQIARQRFAQVELGANPAAEKKKARAADTALQFTLAVAAGRYLAAKKDHLSESTFLASERHLTVHFATLAHRPLAQIKRAEIAAVLEATVSKYGKFAAARSRSTLSALFAWAIGLGLVEANPTLGTNDPAKGAQSRDRVLSDKELAAAWRACADDAFGKIVKLLILTGCRRDEIGGLRWSEVDLDAGTITVTAERSKNRRSHCLTLPQAALDILAAIPRQGDFVFGHRSGFADYSHSMDSLRSRLPATMPAWTLHDLRRTMRTGLGRLGVLPHICEYAINHAPKGLIAVYDKGRYSAEITAALAVWADHVAAIIDGRDTNVTVLKRA